tara:strand:- start:6445 stop:7662 length:1218 start_codon:yes stop_codon:yes gene_type:complete
LKILIITQYFWPENFRINDLASYFSQEDHKITVLTGYPNYPDGEVFKEFKANRKNFSSYNDVEIKRVPIISRGKSRFKLVLNYVSFIFSATLYGMTKINRKDYDLIFVYEPSPVTVCIPAIFISRKKIPIVFWVLDLWPDSLIDLGIKNKFVIGFVEKVVKYIYSKCTVILGQSETFVRKIKKISPTSDVIFFPSWSEKLNNKINDKTKSLVRFDKNSFNIVFAGNIGQAQDFQSVLKAARELKEFNDIKWTFLGDGRALNESKLLSKDYDILNNVSFPGRVPLSDVAGLLNQADALLISLAEGQAFSSVIPAKLQTYLQIGKPILGMLSGEGANIIKQAKVGLTCKPGDYEQLAKNILKLKEIKNENLKAMGKNGPRFSNEYFQREMLLRKLNQILTKVVKEST